MAEYIKTEGTLPIASGSRTPRNTAHLPAGCSWGPLYSLEPTSGQIQIYPQPKRHPDNSIPTSPTASAATPIGRLIWVDFPPESPTDPFHFPRYRKLAIVAVATYFTGITAFSTSAYSIGVPSMTRDLGNTALEAAAGLALYAWGFGIAPMVLAPLSEEYGRKWTYVIAVVIFTVLHLMLTL